MEIKYTTSNAFQKMWRPAMGWSYMVICMFDFMFAPIVFALINPGVTWIPVTMGNGGLYHISMTAIVGVTAWGRTQEKLKAMGITVPAVITTIPGPTQPNTPQIVLLNETKT